MRLIDADWLTKTMYEISDEYQSEHIFIDAIVDEIGNAPTIEVPRWIPVTERLPEDRQRVLVRMIDGTMDVWEFQNYGIGWWQSAIWKYRTEAITHWMPLPDAPKDGE